MESTHIVLVGFSICIGCWFYVGNSQDRRILSSKVADEYDYVIVGGGSAGSVLASRLSEDEDARVLLLEAGGFYDENPEFHIPSHWLALMHTWHDWDYYTTPQKDSSQGMKDKRAYWPRGRVLGGSSVFNAMQYTRGSPLDFDGWAAAGCTGWSYKETLPYFLKSENIQISELKSSRYHSSGGPLTVSSGKATSMGDYYLRAGEELGYNITDYNSASPEGFSVLQLTVKNGVRSSTSLAFLSGTEDRNNLDIVIETLVSRIDIQDNRAVGVYYIRNGRRYYVKASKEVIVSAGSINSPQLLMLSGIGPKKHLTELGIPIVADLPVGENLQDHQMLVLRNKVKLPLSIDPSWRDSWWTEFRYKWFGTGPMSVTGNEVNAFVHVDKNNHGKTYPDIQFIFGSYLLDFDFINIDDSLVNDYLGDYSQGHGITTFLSLGHPKSKGTIKLSSRDPYEYPVIDARYFSEKKDIETLTGGIRIWEKFLETKTMQQLGVDTEQMRMPVCSQHKFRSDAYWECFIRHFAATIYHHSGTCKMGAASDVTAVVDPELRVKGIKGLRVVDASVLPQVTSGNTNAPIIMVAERASDLIRGKDTVDHIRKKLANY